MNARAMGFLEDQLAGNNFWSGPKRMNFLDMRLPLPESTSPEKFGGGDFDILKPQQQLQP